MSSKLNKYIYISTSLNTPQKSNANIDHREQIVSDRRSVHTVKCVLFIFSDILVITPTARSAHSTIFQRYLCAKCNELGDGPWMSSSLTPCLYAYQRNTNRRYGFVMWLEVLSRDEVGQLQTLNWCMFLFEITLDSRHALKRYKINMKF